MRTFHLNKLVRDKIVADMKRQGQIPEYRMLSHAEMIKELTKKLLEEISEISSDEPGMLLSELADVQEVLDSLLHHAGYSKSDIRSIQSKKRRAAGSFKKGHYVGALQVPAESPWSDYYAKEPQRFPEDS